jgi:hypothetical protein
MFPLLYSVYKLVTGAPHSTQVGISKKKKMLKDDF